MCHCSFFTCVCFHFGQLVETRLVVEEDILLK